MTSEAAIAMVLNSVRDTLCKKNDQYSLAGKTDRFRNFWKAGSLTGLDRERQLLTYVAKHVVRLFDEYFKKNTREVPVPTVQELAGDIACYMVLLQAMSLQRESE